MGQANLLNHALCFGTIGSIGWNSLADGILSTDAMTKCCSVIANGRVDLKADADGPRGNVLRYE
jgi:hypothetical protein